MADEVKRFRKVSSFLYEPIWPGSGASPEVMQSRRHLAIAEVLQRIPQEGYDKLVDRAETFSWLIPDYMLLGGTYPFPPDYTPPPIEIKKHSRPTDTEVDAAPSKGGLSSFRELSRVVWLSPRLEKSAWDIVVAVVAHELAHVALDHRLFTQPDEYSNQEQEVFDQIRGWGFVREALKHHAWCK